MAAAAIFIGRPFVEKISTRKKLEVAICFLFLYLFYLAWFPFNFAWDYERVQNLFASPIRLLPLYDYAMGATLNHARLFIQSLFLLGALVYILRVRYGWFENPGTGIWFAAIFCGILGILQEGGSFFCLHAHHLPRIFIVLLWEEVWGHGLNVLR